MCRSCGFAAKWNGVWELCLRLWENTELTRLRQKQSHLERTIIKNYRYFYRRIKISLVTHYDYSSFHLALNEVARYLCKRSNACDMIMCDKWCIRIAASWFKSRFVEPLAATEFSSIVRQMRNNLSRRDDVAHINARYYYARMHGLNVREDRSIGRFVYTALSSSRISIAEDPARRIGRLSCR